MNVKKKGNAGENKFANWLNGEGICNAYRNSASGATIAKSDVHNDINCNFEVKTVKKLNLMDAYKQSKRDAEMAHSIPYVVIHYDSMPENEWLMVLNNHDWKDLIMSSTLRGKIIVDDSREIKNALYQLDYAKEALRKAKKILTKEV